MWVLYIILNVQFAAHHKIDIMQTETFKTEAECNKALERVIEKSWAVVDAAWCSK